VIETPETQVLDCPKCGTKIRISVRDSGEVSVLGYKEPDPDSMLERLRRV